MSDDKPRRGTIAMTRRAEGGTLPFRSPRTGPTLPFAPVARVVQPAAHPVPGAPWSAEALPATAAPSGARTKSANSSRRSVVPVHHGPALSAVAFPWRLSQETILVVVAKATATIDTSGAVAMDDEAAPLTKDIFMRRSTSGRGLDQERSLSHASDYAVHKRCADITVVGHAYPPGGVGPAALAELSFGHVSNRITRRIAVFGDRRWQRGLTGYAATAPEPFRRMPLVYERAFGGDGDLRNPVGVGLDGVQLPNLEDPARLMTRPEARIDPMSFGPVSKHWGAGAAPLPAHADFPADFDWDSYQHAPIGQRLPAVRGDEPFSFVAMHPECPKLKGALPGYEARCSVAWQNGERRALPLTLDTVAFNLDAMSLSMVWRGHVAIRHPRASEIAAVTLGIVSTSQRMV